jgi:hypothetical protein
MRMVRLVEVLVERRERKRRKRKKEKKRKRKRKKERKEKKKEKKKERKSKEKKAGRKGKATSLGLKKNLSTDHGKKKNEMRLLELLNKKKKYQNLNLMMTMMVDPFSSLELGWKYFGAGGD